MSFLNNIKIAVKLPFIMLSLSAVALIAMGFFAYNEAKGTLIQSAEERMEIALETRSENISTWYKTISREVIAQSSSPSSRRAVNEFIGAWAALPGNKTDFLQENFPAPDPTDATDAESPAVMNFSAVQTDYSRRHRRHHPVYETLMKRNAYYDVFLFDLEGNLVYSVLKEADFATNLVTGTLNESGLATAYKQALTLGPNETAFVDLKPYAPSNDDLAGFMAAPILSVNGSVMGVYAIQISTESVHEVFDSYAGLGETGITLAVGPDYHPRLGSNYKDEAAIAGITVEPELVDLALSGASGIANVVGINGQDVLAAYALVQFGDVKWALIAQQDIDEVLTSVVGVRNRMLLAGWVIAAFSALIAIFLARSVGKPLIGVGKAMKQVALEGYDTEIPAVGRGDEIGEIASILENLRDTLKKAKDASAETLFKGTAFEGASAGLMIVDQDFTIQSVNSSVTKMLVEHEDQFKKVNADFDALQVVGCNMDIFHAIPKRVRELLTDPANLPFHAEIPVGNTRFSLDINSVLDSDAQQLGCVVEWQDVTQARMGDAVLKAIDQNQVMAEFSADGTLLHANERFLNLTGGVDNGQIGKTVQTLIEFDAEMAEQRDALIASLEGGTSIVGRFRLDGGGGGDGIVEGTFNPVLDRSDKMVQVLLVGNDVTEAQQLIEKAEAARLEQEKAQAEVVDALRVGLRELSGGDLTTEITNSFKPDYEQLRNDFNGAVGTLRDAILDVVENAETVRGEASDISNAADDLSRRTERQAATLEETAASLDELTVSVRSAADGAEQANQVVADARENAESSGKVVREAVDAMSEIQSSSGQISRIISVIDDIAFQTNLLALNAGVEAARAGEAGRGFAVVASEVRALAQRSSDAAREINDLISASGQHVKRGVDLVGRAGEALGEILESVSNISSHVSAIAISASEQSSGLVEINTSVNQLDQVTQQNAAMFEETTAASHALTREAETLSDTMSKFQTGASESNVVAPDFQSDRKVKLLQESEAIEDQTRVNESVNPAVKTTAVAQDSAVAQSGAVTQALSISESDWEDF